MTATIILEILSIITLMLFALPGTQAIWSFEKIEKQEKENIRTFNSPCFENEKSTLRDHKTNQSGFFAEISKIAASIF